MHGIDRGSLVRLAERSGSASVLREGRRLLEGRSIVPLSPPASQVKVTLVGIVRSTNAKVMCTLISQFPEGIDVHLHALDSVPDDLAAYVRSVGPGPRMPHLRRLIEEHHDRTNELIIADDDVTFSRGNGADFLTICRAGAFDLAQPSHGLGSVKSFDRMRSALLSRARIARFVEVGPLVWMSPRAQSILLPLDIGAGMGWGVDVRWASAAKGRLRLGLVDGAPMIHHGAVAASYDTQAESAYAKAAMAEHDVETVAELVGRPGPAWRSWRQRPPWPVEGGRD